jgi:hypothetical protein
MQMQIKDIKDSDYRRCAAFSEKAASQSVITAKT